MNKKGQFNNITPGDIVGVGMWVVFGGLILLAIGYLLYNWLMDNI